MKSIYCAAICAYAALQYVQLSLICTDLTQYRAWQATFSCVTQCPPDGELRDCFWRAFTTVRDFIWKGVITIVQVIVRDNNVDQALRALKKKMQREGLFREMKLRRHYEKPSVKKAREKSEAVRRYRKLERKRKERDGE